MMNARANIWRSRAAFALVGLASLSGCKYFQAPAAPKIQGLERLRLPDNGQSGKVPIELSFKILNPNDHPMELELASLNLRDEKKGDALGKAEVLDRIKLPVRLDKKPSSVKVRLLFDKKSWRRDFLTRLQEHPVRVQGPMTVFYRGHTYDIKLNEVLGADSGTTSGVAGLEAPIEIDAPSSVVLILNTANELYFKTEFMAENRLGQTVELKDLVFSLGAPKSKKPLIAKLRKTVRLSEKGKSKVLLEGTLDLSSSDETLLDDIESQGRKLKIGISGELSGRRLPPTELKEITFEMKLPPLGKETQRDGSTNVTVDAKVQALLELAVSPDRLLELPDALSAITSLLTGSPLNLNINIRNPLPGTVRHEEGRIVLHQGKKKTVLFEAELKSPTKMKPRAMSQIPVRLTLTQRGRSMGIRLLSELFSSSTSLPEGYSFSIDWKAKLPIFGPLVYDAADPSVGPN